MNRLWFNTFAWLVLAGLFNLAFISAAKDGGDTYQKTYKIAEIPGWDDFARMNDEDKKMQALYNESDQNAGKRRNGANEKVEFPSNRARVLMHDFENGKEDDDDKASWSSVPAYCFADHDTLFISMGISWTAGFAFNVKIYGDQFESAYYVQSDGDEKPYKLSLKGKALNEITVKNKFQSLVLDKKASYKPGDQINGYLSYTTETFYEKDDSPLKYNSQYVSGKLYFTCTVKGK